MCAGIVGCCCYLLQPNRSINPKLQFLGYASTAFSDKYILVLLQVLSEIKLFSNKMSPWNSWVPFDEPLGFAEHTLRTSIIIYKSLVRSFGHCSTESITAELGFDPQSVQTSCGDPPSPLFSRYRADLST